MKKIILSLAAVAVVCLAACAQKKEEKKAAAGKKALVVFFSATGTTASAAQQLAAAAGADLSEITPEKPYTSADLDWRDTNSRSYVEMHNPNSHPAIKPGKPAPEAYDIIYLGYPIWWNLAPTIVNTFIEAHRLEGKTIVPFATSGGSGIGNSVAQLKKAYPAINWKDGALLNSTAAKDLQKLMDSAGQ